MGTFHVIGLMSGTSTDALDIALCRFTQTDASWHAQIVKSQSVEYDNSLKMRLLHADTLGLAEICRLDVDFALFCANRVQIFLHDVPQRPLLIASHGHTVLHNPMAGYTLQIGNGEVIAKNTGIATVFDFRVGDVALGGQGAPLVPVGDRLLFADYDACLNIGGFANVSFDVDGQRIAYDIAPANIVLNDFARRVGLDFDDGGHIAAGGRMLVDLYNALNRLDYYRRRPPKSLGREWVELEIYPLLDKHREASIADLLHTFTLHVATQIAQNLRPACNVLATGGGVFNTFLIENVRQLTNAHIIVPERQMVEFKEALIFAFLGLLRYLNQDNCLASVTGAQRNACCGLVALP